VFDEKISQTFLTVRSVNHLWKKPRTVKLTSTARRK
jgi:hypothetical protein